LSVCLWGDQSHIVFMNMRVFSRLFLLLFFSVSVYSAHAQQQDLDSILALIKQHPAQDSFKVQLLSELAYAYHTSSADSTISIAQRAYVLAEKINNQEGRADALKIWAIGLSITSKEKEALGKNEKALAIYREINNDMGAGAVLNNIAIIKHNNGEFQTALDYYHQSLEMRKATYDQKGVAACYNNIGNTYCDMGNYAEALYNLFRGLQIRERLHHKQDVANSLSNIAYVYLLLGKFNEAVKYSSRGAAIHVASDNKEGIIQAYVSLGEVYNAQQDHKKSFDYYSKALQLSKEIGHLNSVALCLNKIGELYTNLEKYTEAEKYYRQALKLSNESGDLLSVSMNQMGLGIVNLKTGRSRQSIEHLQASYDVASMIGSKLHIQQASLLLADAFEKQGEMKKSNFYLRQYVAYKDSIFTDEVAKKSHQIEFDFQLDKKQKEIALLQKDHSIQKEINDKSKLMTIFLGGLVSLFLIFILGLYQSRQKVKKANDIALKQKEEIERQAAELKELNQLKDKIMSIMSHDLRSPVASLTSIISLLDQDMITPEEFVMLKNGMNKQLSAVSLLLDNLLHWSRSQLQGDGGLHKEMISMNTIIEQNIELLHEAAKNKQISLVYQNNEPAFAYADPNHADIVIRNLISNAIKFTKHAGKIEVTAKRENGHVAVAVTDTGIGMTEETARKVFDHLHESSYGTDGEKGTGLGLVLCKDFIEQNNGAIGVKSQAGVGSTFYFTLPVKPSEN
jgi:signal transduction histidine kinase/Tfp pilus assembly protein PilF